MAHTPQLAVLLFGSILISGPLVGWAQTDQPDEARKLEFFEKKVRPVLIENCNNCHSADSNSRGGLRVDDRQGLIVGGDHGPAVVPGQPEQSLLIEAITYKHAKIKMPPTKQLAEEQIADITRWIQDGAIWPRLEIPASLTEPKPGDAKLRAEHWAWQPLSRPELPTLNDATWARQPIDWFVAAELAANSLPPSADADALTLIRRLTFDLTGLPPKPEEIDVWVSECAAAQEPGAAKLDAEVPVPVVEKLVERLLASPAFGERWGRHWLDVARYGESTGSSRNVPYPHAWRYRNYVIDALNNDKPYNQFLIEQIAGDLLPYTSQAQHDEQVTATGFLALGVKDVNQRFKVRFIMDNVDEQIDTVSRAILGLTVSCARCHDHKFDPIPTTDYYALAGIFRSTDLCAGVRNKMGGGGLDYYDNKMLVQLKAKRSTDDSHAKQLEQAQIELAQAKSELESLTESTGEGPADPELKKKLAEARKQVKKIQTGLIALRDPAATTLVTLGVRDAATVGDTEIRLRGEAEKLGPMVPRGFLTTFEVPGAAPINRQQSGRLELAHWLASKHNPLTSRVMVNRVWHQLFGQGLVVTVDNFGVTGDEPSHPAMLDYLANEFIDNNWSIKQLIKSIVLSRTYQLSSEATAKQLAVDPSNRLVWRHSPRRLQAEEIRDAMLAVAGNLDCTPCEGSPVMDFKVMELGNNGAEAQKLQADALLCKRRSVYLPLLRGLTPRSMEVFDFAEQGMVTGSRDSTTVATQALYLLNDPFVRQQSQELAKRLLQPQDKSDTDRILLAYRLAFGRSASASEVSRAQDFLKEFESAAAETKVAAENPRNTAWTNFCQALLASAEFRYLR